MLRRFHYATTPGHNCNFGRPPESKSRAPLLELLEAVVKRETQSVPGHEEDELHRIHLIV